MKKKHIIAGAVVVVIALYFTFFTRVSDINAHSVELRINTSDNSESNVVKIEDIEMIEQLNSIITDRTYYNQSYLSFYSQDEIDYELDLRELSENGQIVKWYKILLNDDKPINLANQSRLDIINLDSDRSNFSKSKSLLLSTEQYKKIIDIIEPFVEESSELENHDFETLVYNDYESIVSLIEDKVGEDCRITSGKNYEIVDNGLIIEIGYTLDNNFYTAEINGSSVGESIEWEYIRSDLILNDIDKYIEIAADKFFEAFLSEKYEDDLIEKKVISSSFEGVNESGYMISLDYKFKVKEGVEVICAGSIEPTDEIGWYQGWHFVTMELLGDNYQLLNYATSP